jgi:hypothetical protein
MSSNVEEGGTRIQRKPVQQQQFPEMLPPQVDPRQVAQQQQMYQQQQTYQQQQMYQQQVPQVPPQQQVQQMIPRQQVRSTFKQNNYVDFDSKMFKYSVLVTVIFLLLNSKIIWKQIMQFPFMGGVEPSIIALLVNSLLAGIVFYMISNSLI